MRILIIATTKEKNKIKTFRMVDLDSIKVSTTKTTVIDQSYEKVKAFLELGNTIANAALRNGEVIGTNGDLKNYPDVINGGSVVIISSIDDLGYMVVNSAGDLKKAPESGLVAFGKQFGIANGKVVTKDGKEFISSISGTYENMTLGTSKAGNGKDLGVRIGLTNTRNSLGKAIGRRVDVEIDETDIFECLSDNKRKVLMDYYIWYTTRLYAQMATSSRFEVSPEKLAKLSQLKGAEKWDFAGVRDSYLMRRFNAKCSLGHSLRYEYLAKSTDKDGNVRQIVFGATCSGDFFEISKEDMAKLVKARDIMTNEITLITNCIVDGKQREITSRLDLFYQFIALIAKNGDKNIVELFGRNVGGAIINFISNNLPITESLVCLATDKLSEVGLEKITEFIGIGEEYKLMVKHNSDYRVANRTLTGLKFVLSKQLEGYYMYDPFNEGHKRRSVGGYNATSRQDRQSELSLLRDTFGSDKYRLVRYGVEDENYPHGIAKYEPSLSVIIQGVKRNGIMVKMTTEYNELLAKKISEFKHEFENVYPEYEYTARGYERRLMMLDEPYGSAMASLICKVTGRYFNGFSINREDYAATTSKVLAGRYKDILTLIEQDYDKYINSSRNSVKEQAEEQARKLAEKEKRLAEEREQEKRREEERIREQILEDKRKANEALVNENKVAEESVMPAEISVSELGSKINALDKKNSLLEDWNIKIVKDIADRKLKYKDLTAKQQHIVDKAYALLNNCPKCVLLKEFRENLAEMQSVLGDKDNGLNISIDIANKCENDTDLSAKQLWRITDTVERFKAARN